MATKDVVWAMQVRAFHNSLRTESMEKHHTESMENCNADCKKAHAILSEDNRIKRAGGIK